MGGLTSCGKSTFVAQLACQVAEMNGVPVILYSLEQDVYDLVVRTMSRLSGTVNRDIAQGRLGLFSPETDRLRKAFDDFRSLADLLYFFGPETGFSFRAATDAARHVMHEHETDECLMVIDSVQDILPGGQGMEYEKMNAVCREIVHLAAELESPVIVTSEINRDAYERAGESREAALKAFRGSGRLEYCSDIAMVMDHREGTFECIPRHVRVRVLKNRMGETGTVFFKFFTPVSDFRETDERFETGSENKKTKGWQP